MTSNVGDFSIIFLALRFAVLVWLEVKAVEFVSRFFMGRRLDFELSTFYTLIQCAQIISWHAISINYRYLPFSTQSIGSILV